MLNYRHIRPLRMSPSGGGPSTPQYCGEVVCQNNRITCRREHDDRDCGAVYGCGAGRQFTCGESDHGCTRRFKCHDFENPM